MPTSKDPKRRAKQLANLHQGVSPSSWPEGASPALKHGARSRHPQRSPEWSPAVQSALGDLEQRVGAELRDGDELVAWAVPSVEAVALQRVAAWRVDRYVADREARGTARPEDFDLASKVAERYHRALEREALTLRSRLEARSTSFDLAQAMAADHDREQREQAERRELDTGERREPGDEHG